MRPPGAAGRLTLRGADACLGAVGDTPSYAGRRVLVTGASGFLGEHLWRVLNKLGAEVHGTYRHSKPEELSDRWRPCDLSDHAAVMALCRHVKPDVVFHLAGSATDRRSIDAVMPTFRDNLVSTVNLLSVLHELGCGRLVLPASMEEPAAGPAGPVPASPHAAATFAAAAYARMFHALYKMPVVVARLFAVYGPGQKDVTKAIPLAILKLLKGEAPKLASGSHKADWVYVQDAVRGLLAIGLLPGLEGDTIDLGSGETHTVRGVVEILCQIIENAPAPEFGLLAGGAAKDERPADAAATFKKTGWKPETPLRTGLEYTVEWYRTDYEQEAVL